MKIFKYIALIFFASLWLAGMSVDVNKWLFEQGWIQDDYRYGDLYRMSNLPDFRVPIQKCTSTKTSPKDNLNLIVAGDSFTEEGRIDSANFGLTSYHWMFVASPSYIPLERTKSNVLVIETVERHVRERFAKPWKELKVDPINIVSTETSLIEKILAFDLPYNTERHESMLFASDFFLKIKEWKATLNYKLFDRIDPKVNLNATGDHLVYYLPSEPGISSAFETISSEEIDTLVENINKTKTYYESLGFDKVVLSIIPNKTSILASDLGNYNHLVERIQTYPKLETEIIDMYSPFMRGKASLFDKGDTHWNCDGKSIWIDKLNTILTEVELEVQ